MAQSASFRRDAAKDVGGYVLGHLKGGRRKKDTVVCRSAITLDADHADSGFIGMLEMLFPHSCVVYSTHSHTLEEPRFRMVIPLSREVSPDEYGALSRLVAETIGMDYFDDSTYEPERLMYWPSTPSDGVYISKVIDVGILNPDEYLSKLSDWTDCSLWPTSKRQSEKLPIRVELIISEDSTMSKQEMTAKEYLSQAYRIERRINSKLEQIEALRSLAEKATATLSKTPNNKNLNHQRMENIIAKIVGLEDEICNDMNDLVDIKRDVVTTVKSVEQPELQTLLELRYLCFKTWEQIAVDVNWSIRQVYYMHGEALQEVERIRH